MNIVEAYIKFNGQLIIIISGLSGCGKRKLAEYISDDFNIKLLKQSNFKIKDYDENIELKSGRKVVNWYTNDAYDWNALNEAINENKNKGVIIEGMSFPKDKLNFMTDIHLHLSISKQNCYEKKKILIEKQKDKYPKRYEDLESGHIKLKFNQIILPYYFNSLKESVITKFINGNDLSDEKIYDSAFDIIIEFIQKFIDEYNKSINNDNKKKIIENSLKEDAKLAELGRQQREYEEDLALINYQSSSITEEEPMENIIYNRFRESSSYDVSSSS